MPALQLSLKLSAESVAPGATVTGELAVEAEAPFPLANLSLALRGTAGWSHYAPKASDGAVDYFLQTPIPITPSGLPAGGASLSGASSRFTFEFTVPPATPLTLMSGDWRPRPNSRDERPGEGLFVFYTVEGVLKRDFPHSDVVATCTIGVNSESKLLGTLASTSISGTLRDVRVDLRVDSAEVTAGGTLQGSWTLQNPRGHKLYTYVVGLGMQIDVRDRDGETFLEGLWLNPSALDQGRFGGKNDGNVPVHSAEFRIAIPENFKDYRNSSGRYYQARWVVFVSLPELRSIFSGSGWVAEAVLDPPGASRSLQ